jgi:orotate phosphoribosyltransferase
MIEGERVDVLQRLDEAGAVYLDRHFVYTSGKHGSGYINSDPIFTDPRLMSDLCAEVVEPFTGEVDTVAAPATGGIVMAVLSARAFVDRGEAVAITWADKVGGGQFAFERAGFAEKLEGKRVLVVEDLLNTGGSVEKVCRLVEQHGGTLVGVSVVCNRGGVTAGRLRVPRLESLADVDFLTMDADACDLCAAAVPIVADVGHGDAYRSQHPDYAGGYIDLLG